MAQWINNLNVGDIVDSNNFGKMEVIYINGSRDVGVRFINTDTIVSNLQKGNVVRGTVSDFMVRTVNGIGYLGSNIKVTKSGAYDAWHSMLERCYSELYHITRPTYRDCTVSEEWQNFTNFKKWYDDNYITGYHLDKDLLKFGNKLYSPNTCCFIPQQINSLIKDSSNNRGDCPLGVSKRKKKGTNMFNGLYNVSCGTGKKGGSIYIGRFTCPYKAFEAYKEFKEFLLYNYGEYYFERGLINEQVYKALTNFVVIDDSPWQAHLGKPT